jgi:hypothetical protein
VIGVEFVHVAEAAWQEPGAIDGLECFPLRASLQPFHQALVVDVPPTGLEVEVMGAIAAGQCRASRATFAAPDLIGRVRSGGLRAVVALRAHAGFLL